MNKPAEALRLAEAGRFEEAKTLFEEMLAEHPHDAETLYNLAMCFTELGHPVKAVKALEQSIKYRPDYANAQVAMGFAYIKLGDFENAKKYLMSALEMDPKNSYAMRNLGGLYGKLGDNAKAVLYLERAYGINPSDPQTIYGLGHTYEQLKDSEKADRYYREVLKAGESTQIKELAKDGLRRIAASTFKSKGPRFDAVFYLLSALRLFKDKSDIDVQRIAFEIGLKGRSGFDINNPDKKYALSTLPGQFTGLQLVCYMYAGFKRIDPSKDIGFDLAEQYATALQLFDAGDKP